MSHEVAEALRARYALEGDEAADAANLAVYLLGALLLFGGLASFVAWNWSAISPALKIGGGVVFMLGIEGLGYWMAYVDRRWVGLGQAFVLLGALSFGANLGLVYQALHLEPRPVALLAWSAASAALALALRSSVLAVLASVLAFLWHVGQVSEGGLPGALWVGHAIWLAAAGWGVWLRSAALGAVAVVGGGLAIAFTAGSAESGPDLGLIAGFHVPIGFAVAALGLAPHLPRGGRGVAQAAAAVIVLLAFLASFGGTAEAVAESARLDRLAPTLVATAPALLLAGVSWLVVGGVDARRTLAFGGLSAGALLVGSFAGSVALWLIAHACLVGRVVWDLRRSLSELDRGPFWSAVLLSVALLCARFLEIQTHLLVKAVAYAAAGAGVLLAAHFFERRRKEASNEA